MKFGLRFWIGFFSILCFTSCAVMPVSRGLFKWSAESCGRKSFFGRLCSGLVMGLVSPAYAVTWLIDMPIGLIEFITGHQLVKDPLIKKAAADFEKHYFAEKEAEHWEVQQLVEEPGSFSVKHYKKGELVKEFKVKSLPGGHLEVQEQTV